MHINYKPADGWAADFIPFYWQGEYHLFYLKDFRDIPKHGEGTPWCHLVTRDFVHFTDHGECLARGTVDEQDLYVFTGSAMYGEGKFHIFYTGHNPHYREQGKPEQGVMHAVSDDLYTWTKVPADTFFSPTDRFEPHDWRDPFVFWNESAKEYWMLTAARLKTGPSRRRGCTALSTSKDLVHWEVQEPFYSPSLYYTHECPDLFYMNGWWYLLFSEFSEACLTRYRMARSLEGPWLTPAIDSFDGRALYAAKTAAGEKDRYLFGWNPTRQGNTDTGAWQWGGNLVVHQLAQREDGTLAVKVPETVREFFCTQQVFQPEQALNWQTQPGEDILLEADHRFSCVSLGKMPECARFETSIVFQEPTRSFGLLLRTSQDLETGYSIRLEPQPGRLVLDSWPRPGDLPFMVEIERLADLRPGTEILLEVYVDGTLCEVYLDHQVAMSARLYNHPEGDWGVFAAEGTARFSNIRLFTPQ
jgi:beta-fructofuranosidase